jgi:hypothetical protein
MPRRAPAPAVVHSSICWSPSELPKAAWGRWPMTMLMPTGLPALSLMKKTAGALVSVGTPLRTE